MKTILGNTAVFVILYILFMLPTYYLPYVGSNSFLLNAAGVAAGAGINPAFWPHLGSLIVLVVLAWFRGALGGKTWLVIFPILGAVFDLVPGLSSIPLVPTVMHLLAIILGVVGTPAIVTPRGASTTESIRHDISLSRRAAGEDVNVSSSSSLERGSEASASGQRSIGHNAERIPAAQKSLCGQCGERLEIGDRFCAYCGAPLS